MKTNFIDKWTLKEKLELEKIKRTNKFVTIAIISSLVIFIVFCILIYFKPYPEKNVIKEITVPKEVVKDRIIENKVQIYYLNENTNVKISYQYTELAWTIWWFREKVNLKPEIWNTDVLLTEVEWKTLIKQLTLNDLLKWSISLEERSLVEDENRKKELLQLEKEKSWSWWTSSWITNTTATSSAK